MKLCAALHSIAILLLVATSGAVGADPVVEIPAGGLAGFRISSFEEGSSIKIYIVEGGKKTPADTTKYRIISPPAASEPHAVSLNTDDVWKSKDIEIRITTADGAEIVHLAHTELGPNGVQLSKVGGTSAPAAPAPPSHADFGDGPQPILTGKRFGLDLFVMSLLQTADRLPAPVLRFDHERVNTMKLLRNAFAKANKDAIALKAQVPPANPQELSDRLKAISEGWQKVRADILADPSKKLAWEGIFDRVVKRVDELAISSNLQVRFDKDNIDDRIQLYYEIYAGLAQGAQDEQELQDLAVNYRLTGQLPSGFGVTPSGFGPVVPANSYLCERCKCRRKRTCLHLLSPF